MSALRLLKNFSFVFAAKVITTVLATGAMIFLIRYLGPDNYGIFSYATTISGLIGIFSDFGVSLYLVGEISKNRDDIPQYFSSHFIIQIFISILSVLLLISIAFFQDNSFAAKIIMISAIGLFFSNMHIPYATVLNGLEDMRYFVTLSIFSGLATMSIIFLGIYFEADLLYFSLLTVCPGIFSFVIAFLYAHKHISFIKVPIRIVKKYFYAGIPFGIIVSAGFIYSRIDIVMLKYLVNERDVGLYSAAYKLIYFLNMIPTALSTALYPMLSNYCKNAEEKVESIIINLSKYIFIVTIILAFYVFNYADYLIYYLFGSAFFSSATALRILIFSFVPNCARVPISNYFLSKHDTKRLFFVILGALILNVGLNFYLIPRYSLFGAAAATVICEIIFLLFLYFIFSKHYSSFLRKTGIFKLLIVCAVLIPICKFIPIFIPFFVICILLCLYILKVVDKEEITMFTNIFRNLLHKKVN